jgi:hypothetical protein
MTLITHIWTNKLNVIAGDGRLSDKTLENTIVTDDLRKIYPASNNFIAFHESARINEKVDAPTLLNEIQATSSFSSSQDMTKLLSEKLKSQSKGLSTGFFYGGQFQSTEAMYMKGTNITNDKQKMSIGIRFNSSSTEQEERLVLHLDNAFKTCTSHSVQDFDQYDNHSEEQFFCLLKQFYIDVFNDPIANPEEGIGNKLDVGVINEGRFKWLQTETQILNVINPDT